MTSSHTNNIRIHHYLKMVYERTKNIHQIPQRVHEINELIESNSDIKLILNTSDHYARNDICWGVSQTTSFERSLLVLSMRSQKVEIVTRDIMDLLKHCTYFFYIFSVPIPNSSVKYIHIISDGGVYMYRGIVKLYT